MFFGLMPSVPSTPHNSEADSTGWNPLHLPAIIATIGGYRHPAHGNAGWPRNRRHGFGEASVTWKNMMVERRIFG